MKQLITLLRGYRAKTYKEEHSAEEAYGILRTRSHRRYGSAVKDIDRAVLVRHTIRCPWCGSEEPAYTDFRKPEAQVLAAWADLQLSLFDIHNALTLRTPVYPGTHLCSHCLAPSSPGEDTFTMELESGERTITLSRSIENFSQLMQLNWLPPLRLMSSFPLEEALEFRLGEGARLLLKCDRAVLCEKAVTAKTDSETSELIRWAEQSIPLRRTLRRCFAQHWQLPFPFSTRELTMKQFLLVNRFVGFPKSFFLTIPFQRNSYQIEETFAPAAASLRFWQEAPGSLKNTKLPSTPSLRRILGQEPGLLFYLAECEQIWNILGDINLLCRLLQSSCIYQLLAELHTYPGLLEMYRDFKAVKGSGPLCDALATRTPCFHSLALLYCALSTHGRKAEQVRWKKERWYHRMFSQVPEPDFSVPMQLPPAHIPDRSIQGYQFRWLRTRQDYTAAGNALGNCLTGWRADQPPVTLVLQGRQPVAALEVFGTQIIQAYQERNKRIEPNSPLDKVIRRWCAIYGLAYKNT